MAVELPRKDGGINPVCNTCPARVGFKECNEAKLDGVRKIRPMLCPLVLQGRAIEHTFIASDEAIRLMQQKLRSLGR